MYFRIYIKYWKGSISKTTTMQNYKCCGWRSGTFDVVVTLFNYHYYHYHSMHIPITLFPICIRVSKTCAGSLYHYITICIRLLKTCAGSLYRYITISLYHYITISLYVSVCWKLAQAHYIEAEKMRGRPLGAVGKYRWGQLFYVANIFSRKYVVGKYK